MTERWERDIEAGLIELAGAERAAHPRPGPDLMARVLTDAAAVSAPAVSPGSAPAPSRRRRGWRWPLAGAIGVPGLAAAGMACVVLGLGLGYALESGMPQPGDALVAFDGLMLAGGGLGAEFPL